MKKYLYTAIGLFLFFGQSTAQKELSLSEAIKTGLSKNFDIEIANLRERTATQNRKMGVPERLPTIGFTMDQRNRASIDNSPTSFVGGTYAQNEISAGVDMNWVLFNGFKARIDKERLNELEKQSIGQSQLVVENTIEAIILAYYKAVIEQEKLKVMREVRDFSLEEYQKSKEERRLGEISDYDLNNFENALLADSLNCFAQEVNRNEALIQLSFLMSDKSRRRYKLTSNLNMNYTPEKYNLEQLERQLINSNQDIKNQYVNLKLQENASRLLRAERKPKLTLRSGLSEELNTSKFTNEVRNNGAIFDFYVNFSFSYTIFDGRKLKQQIQEAQIEELIANQEIERLKSELQEKLRIRYEKYVRQSKVLRLRKRLITNLEKNTYIALSRVEGGYSSFIEYRGLQIELLEAKLDLLETVFELKVAETEISRLIGGITKARY